MLIYIIKSHLKRILSSLKFVFRNKIYIAVFCSLNRFQQAIERLDWLSFELTIDVRVFPCASAIADHASSVTRLTSQGSPFNHHRLHSTIAHPRHPPTDAVTRGHHRPPSSSITNDHGTPQHIKINPATPRHKPNERRWGRCGV